MSFLCQVELAILLNGGVRVDSARTRALISLVMCFLICSVVLNPLLPLTTQQSCFAATFCTVWNQTASAARLSAGNVVDPVAPGAPAVRFVGVCCNILPSTRATSKYPVRSTSWLELITLSCRIK